MIPTNKLRFLLKAYTYETTDRITGCTVTALNHHRILQQWWQEDTNDVVWVNKLGEWRDVPMEDEE